MTLYLTCAVFASTVVGLAKEKITISLAFFSSKGTFTSVKRKIRGITGFKDLSARNVYLGNSFIFGSSKAKEF